MEVNQGRIQEFVQGGGLAPIAPPLEYASEVIWGGKDVWD